MRVTNQMIKGSVTRDIMQNTERLFQMQNIVSTGKRINRPSDDPVGMSNVLDYRKTLSSINQYESNIAHGEMWIEVTESSLETINDLLGTAKNIAIDYSSETIELDTREEAATTIKQIYDQVLDLANSTLGDSYIFAGHKTDTPPFSRNDDYHAAYSGDNGDIKIVAGEDVDIKINTTGEDLFVTGVNVFDALRDLKDALEAPIFDASAVSAQIEPLIDACDQIQKGRTENAGTFTRLETTKNQLAGFKLNVEDMLYNTENADMTRAIMELQSQETAYQASIATGARIIQPSLLDYLK